MIFIPLSSLHYPFVRNLYESAFPYYERRTWEQLLSMLSQKAMQIVVVKGEEKLAGFAVYWKLNNWYFLEHLAIDPLREGKGFGSAVMQYLLQQSGNQLLLETELAVDEISNRRIRFYQKQGLQIAPFHYRQPPFRLGEFPPAMHIMSVPVITSEDEFASITSLIRQQVFEAFY